MATAPRAVPAIAQHSRTVKSTEWETRAAARREPPGRADITRARFDRRIARTGRSRRALVLERVDSEQLAGRDPLGPRPLWLWRLEGDRAALLARGHSTVDGRIELPSVRVPPAGLSLVVTPEQVAPGGEGTSARLELPGTSLAVPGVQRIDPARLRIHPREPGGRVLIADAVGVEWLQLPTARLPDAAHRGFEISLPPQLANQQLWAAHEAPDGRRSLWAAVPSRRSLYPSGAQR